MPVELGHYPDETLAGVIDEVASGGIDAVAFTSAHRRGGCSNSPASAVRPTG
jgi:hypothetical protein